MVLIHHQPADFGFRLALQEVLLKNVNPSDDEGGLRGDENRMFVVAQQALQARGNLRRS